MDYSYSVSAVEAGQLDLHGRVYHFESVQVEFLNEEFASV